MNEHLLKRNGEIFKELNIVDWQEKGIIGKGIKVAILGYGGCLVDKKPYLTNINYPYQGRGSYHDGDEIIHNVAPNSKIFGINIFSGGWSFEKAFEWCHDKDIDVICSSLRKSSWNDKLKSLSKQLYDKGCIMIDSADNEGNEESYKYPALDPHWFVVGAYDGKGRAGYSSYGIKIDCLMYTNLVVESKEGIYTPITHTSGAVQTVAGIAALLKETFSITPEGFKQFIKENCIDVEDEGYDIESGYGLFVLPSEIPSIEEVNPMDYFNDDNGRWHEKFNNRLAELGIVVGDGDGNVRPDDYITRAEVNKIVAVSVDFMLSEMRKMLGK